MSQQVNSNEAEPIDFELYPEDPPLNDETLESEQDFSRSLEATRLEKTFQTELAKLAQDIKHQGIVHWLRVIHSFLLMVLAVVWVVFLCAIVFFQGIGVFPWKPEGASEYLKFSLEESVIIAFMTSTTATVLGLYGIAAYWLFGKPKPKDEERPSEKKDDDSKSK